MEQTHIFVLFPFSFVDVNFHLFKFTYMIRIGVYVN